MFMMLSRTTIAIRLRCAFLPALVALLAGAAAAEKEKLQVYVLSGQSNMVGHAPSYLLGNLSQSPRAGDGALAQKVMVDFDQAL